MCLEETSISRAGPTFLRALVVADDCAEARLCERTLRELGVEAERADGTDVLARLEAQVPDIVVIDRIGDAATVVGWARCQSTSPVVVLVASAGAEPSLVPDGVAGRQVVMRPLDPIELANAVAFGLHHRARGQRSLTADELGALRAISATASSALAPPEALGRMLGQVLAATGAEHGALLKVCRAGPRLAFTLSAMAGKPPACAGTEPPKHQGVCAWVAENRRPLWLVGPLDRYPQFQGLEPNPGIGASLVAPITWLNHVVGVLTVNTSRADGLAAEQLAFVASAAELVGILMHHLEADPEREHRQRLSMLGQMAASIAHELSNPVAFIRSNLEFVLGQIAKAPGVESGDKEELVQILRESLEGVARITSLATDMKSMSRKDPGKCGPVSLSTVLRRCETLVLARFKHRLELSVELGPELQVVAEPEALMQVFLNLLLNAAEVVPERAGRVVVRCVADKGCAQVEVEDNGPGIPDSVAARLFEPFFTTRAQGTGLGLAISREIVQRSGGDLTFVTKPSQGTRFFVRLPLFTPAERQVKSLLVVEDDESLLKALVRVLKRSGYDTVAALSSREALAVLSRRKVDAILTDFRMPGGTGADLVREIRGQGSKTPVMLITANFDCGEVREALAEGLFAASLAKPWNQEDLLSAVAGVLAA
jgi:signal transduction histidine kinase/DNA-binding response OmpR family regulator